MKRLAGCVLAMILAVSMPAGAAAPPEKLYSIQVRAVPAAQKTDAMATYRMLRDKGYLVYHYVAAVDGRAWLRVAVGAFDRHADAAAFGKTFSAKEELEHFVARAPVAVLAAERGDFVVTPSALWTRAGGKTREVLAFDSSPPDGFAAPDGIELVLSPDKRAVAFQYGARVYAVRLGGNRAVWLNKGAVSATGFSFEKHYGPAPFWSPSGRYIAFHDFLEFEVPTTLWLVGADGSGLRPLRDNSAADSQRSVKAFAWHPSEDRILFIESATYGAASMGGAIRSIDMEGKVTTVAAPERPEQQYTGPLEFRDGHLHYRTWELEEDKDGPTIGKGKVRIGHNPGTWP